MDRFPFPSSSCQVQSNINLLQAQAAIVVAEDVAGGTKVHDHLCWVDTMSGMYLNSPEDDRLLKAG